MNNSSNFFLELIQRIFTASPKFFKILRWAAGVLVFLIGGTLAIISNGIWLPSFADGLTNILKEVMPYLVTLWGLVFSLRRTTQRM